MEWYSTNGSPDEVLQRLLRAAEEPSADNPASDIFYRELCLNLARAATSDFKDQKTNQIVLDAVAAIRAFLQHQETTRQHAKGEVSVHGSGFRAKADVHQCQYVSTCKRNLKALGEVPHCIRAVTLIKAIDARLPHRPPMTYDLRPGLVDETSAACHIELRPAGEPSAAFQNPPPVPAPQ